MSTQNDDGCKKAYIEMQSFVFTTFCRRKRTKAWCKSATDIFTENLQNKCGKFSSSYCRYKSYHLGSVSGFGMFAITSIVT